MPRGEGDMSGEIRRMSIAGLDPGHFPDEALLPEAHSELVARDGMR